MSPEPSELVLNHETGEATVRERREKAVYELYHPEAAEAIMKIYPDWTLKAAGEWEEIFLDDSAISEALNKYQDITGFSSEIIDDFSGRYQFYKTMDHGFYPRHGLEIFGLDSVEQVIRNYDSSDIRDYIVDILSSQGLFSKELENSVLDKLMKIFLDPQVKETIDSYTDTGAALGIFSSMYDRLSTYHQLDTIKKKTGTEIAQKIASIFMRSDVRKMLYSFPEIVRKKAASYIGEFPILSHLENDVDIGPGISYLVDAFSIPELHEFIDMPDSGLTTPNARLHFFNSMATTTQDNEMNHRIAKVFKEYAGKYSHEYEFMEVMLQMVYQAKRRGLELVPELFSERFKEKTEAYDSVKTEWVLDSLRSAIKSGAGPEELGLAIDLVLENEIASKIMNFRISLKNLVMNEQYRALLKEDAQKGLLKIQLYDKIGAEESGQDIHDFDSVIKYICETSGINAQDLTLAETISAIDSRMSIIDDFHIIADGFRKKNKAFKTALRVLGSGSYWDQEEIVERVQEMKALGLDSSVLEGEAWSYSLGPVRQTELSFDTAISHLWYALLGSRKNPDKVELAKQELGQYIGQETLETAIGQFKDRIWSEWRKDGKLKDRIELMSLGQYNQILDMFVQEAERLLKESGDKYNPLFETIKSIESLGSSELRGDHIIGFVGKEIPLMFRNDTTMSCSDLPNGENKYASILYELDPRIVQIGYAFNDRVPTEQDYDSLVSKVRDKGLVDGKVIAYIGLKKSPSLFGLRTKKEPYLLIDSVEGGQAFRDYIDSEQGFGQVYDDIVRTASRLGVSKVLVNNRPCNQTPEKFLEKLKEHGFEMDSFESEIIGSPKIPLDSHRNEQYLEAFHGWKIPQGTATGYLIDVSKGDWND